MAILVTLIAAVFALAQFSKDRDRGWSALVFLLLALPVEARIPTPGVLPELTVHRLLLAIGLMKSFGDQPDPRLSKAPFAGLWFFISLIQFVSALLSEEIPASLKTWLGFATEQWLFFWMLWNAVRTRETLHKVLLGAAAAITVVGLIALFERYGGRNLAAMVVPGMKDNAKTITSTFRHRILYGYFMAMGIPVMIALIQLAKTNFGRRLGWLGLCCSGGGSYISISRGPWLGSALGGGYMFLTGGGRTRKILVTVGIAAVAFALTRPGVYETLYRLYTHTKTTDTHKGRSAAYRMELWRVGWHEITQSPIRFLVGYGGGSLETMDLGDQFEFGGNAANLGYTSWDSELAASLVKYGSLGFGGMILLYMLVGFRLLGCWQTTYDDSRILIAAATAVFGIYMFSLTNVAIFNAQIPFLIWTVVVLGLRTHEFALVFRPTEDDDDEDYSKPPRRTDLRDRPPMARNSSTHR
ncbi:MAG: O-antigen ligase family protein [Verrucomicrobiales bacterium]|nr:O-antigen ligase family protein [Verrucomicrobiales bacterium]